MRAQKRHAGEQLKSTLRVATVLLSQCMTMPWDCQMLGITEQTFHRWRKEYGGVRTDTCTRFS